MFGHLTSPDYNESCIDHDTMRVDERGYVVGECLTIARNGYHVRASVSSYSYNGTNMNHVPLATLVDEGGRVIHESEQHDTRRPAVAMDRARSGATFLLEHYDEFIDG